MPENNSIVFISAFSGLAGAILAQSISGVITYFSDKRKQGNEIKAAYRNKKMEVGENFYYVTSEKVSIIKAHILYWKKREFVDSESGLNFLNEEMKKLSRQLDSLNTEGWKCNLVNMYFDVRLDHDTVIETNAVSRGFYLKFLDAIDALKQAHDGEDKGELQARYAVILFDMCSHYEDLCQQMEQDMLHVKTELLRDFGMALSN